MYIFKSREEKAFFSSKQARVYVAQGLHHGLNGSPITANPYKGVKGYLWERGWHSGCQEAVEY